MKTLFLHVYSEKNAGDAAIVSVMLADYRARSPQRTITLSSITPQNKESFEGAPYVSSFFCEAVYRGRSLAMRLLNTTRVIGASLLFLLINRVTGLRWYWLAPKNLRPFLRALLEADEVVGVGGGYIITKPGISFDITLLLTLYEFWYAKQLGKRVCLYAQSIGPFVKGWHGRIAAAVLNSLDSITLREELSRRRLEDLGVSRPILRRAYDAAFYFASDTREAMRNVLMKKGVFFTRPVVGITVRSCFPDIRQTRFEQAVACCAQRIADELGYKVVFIPHVTAVDQQDDDRVVTERIQSHLKAHRDIIFLKGSFTAHELKGLYANLDAVVGTRMHSVIFALASGVPAIGIAYEPKMLGVMKMVGLDSWVLMAEEVTADVLYARFCKLHSGLMEYKMYLRQRAPWVVRADTTVKQDYYT